MPNTLSFKQGPLKGCIYPRNNKAKGEKHIKCFPHCCEAGHTLGKFCGSSVQCELILETSEPAASLWAVGEFRTMDIDEFGDDAGTTTEIPTYTEVQKRGGRYFTGYLERKDHRPSLDKAVPCAYSIEFKPTSWPYSWSSNRWSCGTTHHTFAVYIFRAEINANKAIKGTYKLVTHAFSQPFLLASARRMRNPKMDIKGVSNKLGRLRPGATRRPDAASKKPKPGNDDDDTEVDDDSFYYDSSAPPSLGALIPFMKTEGADPFNGLLALAAAAHTDGDEEGAPAAAGKSAPAAQAPPTAAPAPAPALAPAPSIHPVVPIIYPLPAFPPPDSNPPFPFPVAANAAAAAAAAPALALQALAPAPDFAPVAALSMADAPAPVKRELELQPEEDSSESRARQKPRLA